MFLAKGFLLCSTIQFKTQILIFRFVITGADLYVYRYMVENSSKFPCEVIENMRNWMFKQGYLKGDLEDLVKDSLEGTKKFDESIGKLT